MSAAESLAIESPRALEYTARGWPVFPCGHDKKPLTVHGFKDATIDAALVRKWWTEYPHALVAVPTGHVSGVLVVDIDPDGAEWYHENALRLQCRCVVHTRRGHHLYYQMPDADVACSTSKIARGVDVRASGGYVIAWAAHGHEVVGDLDDIGPLPEWLLEGLTQPQRSAVGKASHAGERIPNGQRDSTLASLAGTMRRRGMDSTAIYAALAATNTSRCDPPLDDSDVRRIATSVARYEPEAREASGQRALKGVDFDDMRARLSDGYVVKGLLGQSSLAAIIAASGSGKTFFVCDLGCHIAANLSWRGHRVRHGLVVYCALEGSASTENRFAAWGIKYKPEGRLPLRMMPEPINLRSRDDVAALAAFVKAAETDHGIACVLVIVDTLSRAMAGGDENGPEDMTALIEGADTIRAMGPTVMLVHHHGKDESRGARGHSSLKAALDTEIEITVDGDLKVATVSKQRDLPSGAKYAFKLEPVELGHDTDGEPVSSCVVVSEEAPNLAKRPSGKNQNALLAGLQEWHRRSQAEMITTAELREVAKAQGLNRKRTQEATEGLERFGWIQSCVGGFRLLLEEPR